MKRKLLWLDEDEDYDAIRRIKARYGCESDSAAMRLALRVFAASPMLQIPLKKATETRKEHDRS